MQGPGAVVEGETKQLEIFNRSKDVGRRHEGLMRQRGGTRRGEEERFLRVGIWLKNKRYEAGFRTHFCMRNYWEFTCISVGKEKQSKSSLLCLFYGVGMGLQFSRATV